MADPTDLDLNSPDPKNGHDHRPRPYLCSACSQIDFKALFTSHACPSIDTGHRRTCKCFEILDARQKHGWPGPKSANDLSEPLCCFCKFYNECRLQFKDIPPNTEIQFRARREILYRVNNRDGPLLQGSHSLAGIPIKHRGGEDRDCRRHFVQDVYALQLCESGGSGCLDETDNAILRVVDGPKFPGLTRERAAGGGLLARRIIPHQVNYKVIGEWLSLCRSEHVHCDGDADVVAIPGFQVIDCTTTRIVSVVDHLASSGEPGRVEYLTLSYVWGQAGAAGVKGPVMREDGLTLPDDLPLVVSDAMEVVRRLGYRYLWIDRYCIPQNDSQAKLMQIRKMDRIYSCSVLTIIAAAGDGPEYGLPGVSSRHRTEQLNVQVTEEISLLFYKTPRSLVAASKWNTRGWTFQEGLLSKRRLVFTDEMTYFQCYEMHGDEVLSLPLPIPGRFSSSSGYYPDNQFDDFGHISFEDERIDFGCVFPPQFDWSNPQTAWDRIEQFAQRQLALDEDTLDAIAGIFGRYLSFNTSKTTEHRILFFCGLPVIPFPQEDLPKIISMQKLWVGPSLSLCGQESAAEEATCRLVNSLLWVVDWNSLKFESMGMPTNWERHLRRPGFPSWTWAGWKNCMIFRQDEGFEGERVYDSCTTVHVEHEDEAGLLQRLDWVKDNERINNLPHQESGFPMYLLIKGTAMDMKLAWRNEPENRYSKLGGYWIITSPPFLNREEIRAPRCLFEDIQPPSGDEPPSGDDKAPTYHMREKEVHVLGMVMTSSLEKRSANNVMMLRPVTRLLKGRPETMYERAHLHRFSFRRFDEEYPRDHSPPPSTESTFTIGHR